MATSVTSRSAAGLGLGLVAAGFCLGAAYILANSANTMGIAVTLGVMLAIVCFLWPEIGLYVLLFSMLLSPEIIAGGMGGGTTGSRGVTLRLDDFLLLLIAFTWLARGAVYKDLGLFAHSPINRGIFFYLIAAAVSTGIGILFNRVSSPLTGILFVIKYVEYVVVYFAMMNYVQDRVHLRRLVWVAFFTAVLVSLYGILQIPQGVRVSAPFEGANGEPNTLGGYLLFMMAMLGGLLVHAPTLRDARKYILGLLILGIPFLYTLSRASYLGLAGAAPLLILFSRRKVIASFSIGAFILALALIAPKPVVERIGYTVGGQQVLPGQVQIGGLRLDTSTSARIETTGQVFEDFQKEPVFGYGVTGYGFIDGQYQRVLIEMGLIGLAAFFWLIVSLFRQGWESFQSVEGWWDRGLCSGYLAGLAGLCLHALGTNTFIIVRIMEPFWFFTGVVALLYQFRQKEEREPTVARDVARWSRGLLSPFPYGR